MLGLIFIMTVLLFFGGESEQSHRLIKDTWDTGHLILFGLITSLYFRRPVNASRSLAFKIIVTTLFCLIVGGTVEVIQLFTHRDFSYGDIVNDVLGGYLGLLSLVILNKQLASILRASAAVAFLLLVALGMRDMVRDLTDEISMRRSFPVLASFENSLEMRRWEYSLVDLKRTQVFAKDGHFSLQVTFLQGRYPNISLHEMRRDWSAFHKLVFSVYNPQSEPLSFELKIYDKQHEYNGKKYNDRFNQQLTLMPGWNLIETSLEDIISAPRNRSMDIHNMRVVSIFTDKLEKPVAIYFDNMVLQ